MNLGIKINSQTITAPVVITKVAPAAISLIFLTLMLYWKDMASTAASSAVLITSIERVRNIVNITIAHWTKSNLTQIPRAIRIAYIPK